MTIRIVGSNRVTCSIIVIKHARETRRLFSFTLRHVRRSLNQPDKVARSEEPNIRSAENIRSRTNDCEVINNVTEPGSRVTCRG